MKELFEQHLVIPDRHSSKGNQLKWRDGPDWYKADYTGYEGLAEYMVSHLLAESSLKQDEYVLYNPEQIRYKNVTYNGAVSRDFLEADWQIITLERLYKNFCGRSLYKAVWDIQGIDSRVGFVVEEISRITGLEHFGEYIAKLMTIDAFFLNEDRHMHNIAVLMNGSGTYKLCPVFDNGAALLSDVTMDYPLNRDVYELMDEVKAKTFSTDFDEQLDAVEALYGHQVKFNFNKKSIDELLARADMYSEEERERVGTVLYYRMRKYEYLFRP